MPTQTALATTINTEAIPHVSVHFPIQCRKIGREDHRANRLSASVICPRKTNILRPNRTSVLNTSRFQSAVTSGTHNNVTLQHYVRSCLV
jgi:hypothetical protein